MANTMANIIVFAIIALIALVRAQTITTTNPYALFLSTLILLIFFFFHLQSWPVRCRGRYK